jgi:hypothetical protein
MEHTKNTYLENNNKERERERERRKFGKSGVGKEY